MDGTTVERQKLMAEISTLPNEALAELANFLDYLRYKSLQSTVSASNGSPEIDRADQSQIGLWEKAGILVFETKSLENIDFNLLIEQSRNDRAWEQLES
jgi:hypothetical protein